MSTFTADETSHILSTFLAIENVTKRSKIMGVAAALSSDEDDPELAGEIYLAALNYYMQPGREVELDDDYMDYVQGSPMEWAAEDDTTG